MNRLKTLSYLSFFSTLLGSFYIGIIFVNYSIGASSLLDLLRTSFPAFLFVYVLPAVVTAITGIGAYFLLFRESQNLLFIRFAMLGVTVIQAFALLILVAWLLTTTGLSFFLYLALTIAIVVIYVKLFSPLSRKFTFILQFLVVGLFLSSWYSSMVAGYCASTDTATTATEDCTNTAPFASVLSNESKRIFNR